MSQFKINSITNKEGTFGPVIAGVSTNNSTGCMIIPAGPTEHRGGRGRGVIGGGSLIPSSTAVNTLNLITIATTGDATDFGDLSHGGAYRGGLASSTRGIFASASNDETYDYVTISSQGGANDFGDISFFGTGVRAVSNNTRGLAFGGVENITLSPTNTINKNIEFFTIASTGDGTDFGDLTVARRDGGATGSVTRAIIGGGQQPGPANSNIIDSVEFSSQSNCTDFGDLTQVYHAHTGVSDSHGGLGGF